MERFQLINRRLNRQKLVEQDLDMRFAELLDEFLRLVDHHVVHVVRHEGVQCRPQSLQFAEALVVVEHDPTRTSLRDQVV